jgi:3D (Asp-Asp-Asp) domain-containing protein
MIATAYDLSVVSCGKKRKHKEYGITFTGTKATVKRTVAVDPDTIPLGSRLLLVFEEGKYAKYNGEYIAEDTGSDVKGNIIDIFLGEDKPGSNVIAKEVDDFWSKQVIVYIIK